MHITNIIPTKQKYCNPTKIFSAFALTLFLVWTGLSRGLQYDASGSACMVELLRFVNIQNILMFHCVFVLLQGECVFGVFSVQ